MAKLSLPLFFGDKSQRLVLVIILALQLNPIHMLTYSTSTIGSMTSITFDEALSAAGANDCISFFELNGSDDLFGTGAICTLVTTPLTILTISYGADPVAGAIPMSFKSNGFAPLGRVFGSFTRPQLPSFGIDHGSSDIYQDTAKTISLTGIITNGAPDLLYTWIYIQGGPDPDITTNLTTFTFNFWEMNNIFYEINITVTDPSNSYYSFSKLTTAFEVRYSCDTNNCNRVSWFFSRNPSPCNLYADCIEGEDTTYDNFSLNEVGAAGGTYKVNAYYMPDSHGGTSLLKLEPAIFGNNTMCPGHQFPWMTLHSDAPLCQPSVNILVPSALVYGNRKLLGTGYTLNWEQPSATCMPGEDSCSIISPGAGLNAGGPYQFKLKLTLLCSAQVWNVITFTPFRYAPYFTLTTNIGSIQNLVFSQTLNFTNGESCDELFIFTPGELGAGASCGYITASTTIYIKYGAGVSPLPFTLSLNPSGFVECV